MMNDGKINYKYICVYIRYTWNYDICLIGLLDTFLHYLLGLVSFIIIIIVIITTDNFLMKFWSKFSLRKVRQVIYTMKNQWRITVFNWDQKTEIAVSIYVHHLKKNTWSQQEGPIETLRRGGVGGIWSALGENRVKDIIQRILHNPAWMLLAS